jgi:hypothetical protein
MIAWCSRQRELQREPREGFEPLSEAIRDDPNAPHAHISLPIEAIRELAEPIHKWVSRSGGLPSLIDVIRQS